MQASEVVALPTGPPARPRRVVVEPPARLARLDLSGLWRHRELLACLVRREVKLRYAQTVLGVVWVLLQPLISFVVITIVFGVFVRVPTGGPRYSALVLVGLLPWLYFAQSIATATVSVVADQTLLRAAPFPRLLIPLARVLRALLDLAVGFALLVPLVAWWSIVPGWRLLALPGLVAVLALVALGAGLALAALNVRYRDVGHAVPFVVQLGMLASPVVYPLAVVPESWRPLYGLNPLVAVIEGFRWAVLGTPGPDVSVIAAGLAGGAVVVTLGVVAFLRLEPRFAEIV